MERKKKIPSEYCPATWRSVTFCMGDELGIGFNAEFGPIRLKISIECAKKLVQELNRHISS